MASVDWKAIAKGIAEEQHNENFPSRRGVWFYEEIGKLCYYDNNPWAKCPDLRGAVWLETKRRLEAVGIPVLADEANSDGYTLAMILNTGERDQAFVIELAQQVLREAFRWPEAEAMSERTGPVPPPRPVQSRGIGSAEKGVA